MHPIKVLFFLGLVISMNVDSSSFGLYILMSLVVISLISISSLFITEAVRGTNPTDMSG